VRTLFRLLRAGCHDEAAAMAARCGAAWRAASLSGAGVGLLPVRTTSLSGAPLDTSVRGGDADAADVLAGQGLAVASRYGSDPCSVRQLWRQSCAAVVHSLRQSGGYGCDAEAFLQRWEAAMYGLLAGSVEDVLPVCECWEDAVWAHARSLLQVMPEEMLQRAAANARASREGQSLSLRGTVTRKPWHASALFGNGARNVAPPRGDDPEEAASTFLVPPCSHRFCSCPRCLPCKSFLALGKSLCVSSRNVAVLQGPLSGKSAYRPQLVYRDNWNHCRHSGGSPRSRGCSSVSSTSLSLSTAP
jgi:hypothetical protein